MNRRQFIKRGVLFLPAAPMIFVPRLRAQLPPQFGFYAQQPQAAGGGLSYLIEENCEGTGTPSGWTDSGSFNWDYTATVLQGSHSCINSGGSSTFYTFAGQTTVYGYCLIRVVSLPASANTLLGFRDSAGNPLGLARVNATGNIAIFANGSDSTFTTDAISAGTTSHLWFSFVSGGTCTVEFSTDGTRTGSGNKFTSKTGGSGTAARYAIAGNVSLIADRLLADDVQIGNSP